MASPLRRTALFIATALLGTLVIIAAGGARAAGMASPAEIAAQRQESLAEMMSDDFQPSLIANVRRSCALGLEPAHVVESRSGGAYFTPDAADSCVTALVRTARDGNLPGLYRQLLPEMGGSAANYEQWPRIAGAAVMSDSTAVSIGNHKVIDVTPAIAFDAGFTVAYQEGSAGKAPAIEAQQLKAIAQSCLGQHQDAGTCFSAGYVYGADAFRTHTAAR